MCTKFDQHLEAISKRITIQDEHRRSFVQDFEVIRDHIIEIMRYDNVFDMLCKGASFYGEYANNVRICNDNEFEVYMKISFPYSSFIFAEEDEMFPGYVNLDFGVVIAELEDCYGTYYDIYKLLIFDLARGYDCYLKRANVQRWMSRLMTDALQRYGYFVRGATGILYRLEYSTNGFVHNIYAHGRMAKGVDHSISIDFVPAVLFNRTDFTLMWCPPPFVNKCKRWYAIPKPIEGTKKKQDYAFMICCPKAEQELLMENHSIKVVFRLLKSIRGAYDLRRLRSYFISNAFLWVIFDESEFFWYQPLSVLLIYMLEVLLKAFQNDCLPFFWNSDENLLNLLTDCEFENYADKLTAACNRLKSYVHQSKLSYECTLQHFKIPEGR